MTGMLYSHMAFLKMTCVKREQEIKFQYASICLYYFTEDYGMLAIGQVNSPT